MKIIFDSSDLDAVLKIFNELRAGETVEISTEIDTAFLKEIAAGFVRAVLDTDITGMYGIETVRERQG